MNLKTIVIGQSNGEVKEILYDSKLLTKDLEATKTFKPKKRGRYKTLSLKNLIKKSDGSIVKSKDLTKLEEKRAIYFQRDNSFKSFAKKLPTFIPAQYGVFERGHCWMDSEGQLYKLIRDLINFGRPLYNLDAKIDLYNIDEKTFITKIQKTSFEKTWSYFFKFKKSDCGKPYVQIKGKRTPFKVNQPDSFAFASNILNLYIQAGAIKLSPKLNGNSNFIGIDCDRKGNLYATLYNEKGRLLKKAIIKNKDSKVTEDHNFSKMRSILCNFRESFLELKNKSLTIHLDGTLFHKNKSEWERFQQEYGIQNLNVVRIIKSDLPPVGLIRDDEISNSVLGTWAILSEKIGLVVTSDKDAEKNCPRGLVVEKVFGGKSLKDELYDVFQLVQVDPFVMFRNPPLLPVTIRYAADKNSLGNYIISNYETSHNKCE